MSDLHPFEIAEQYRDIEQRLTTALNKQWEDSAQLAACIKAHEDAYEALTCVLQDLKSQGVTLSQKTKETLRELKIEL